MTETLNPHTLTVTLHSRDGIGHKFACSAPEGASCRLVCPNGCEEVAFASHVQDMLGEDQAWLQPLTDDERADITRRHTLVDGGDCNPLTFIDNDPDTDSFWELYDGEPTTLHDGPVTFTWHTEGYVTWHYADATPAALAALASRPVL